MRVSIADFAAFIHVEGDLAEVHVVELLVERDRVALDGGNGAALCLPGIEVRRREHNLLAGLPVRSAQDLDRGAARFGGLGQLGPGALFRTVQVQGSAHQHDAAVTAVIAAHSTEIFAFDVVSEGDGRLVRVGLGFRADLQLPVHHDPLGGQFQIFVIREAQFAVDRQTVQRRRSDIEDDVHVPVNGDHGVFGGHLLVRPGGGIGPALRRGWRSSFLLGFEAAYPPRPKKAGTSNERSKSEVFAS